MGIVGRGRIVTEERVEFCGAYVVWHAVMFVDDDLGREREVGRAIDRPHAEAIQARWEKETCRTFEPTPIKYSESGMNGRERKKPGGRDPLATKKKFSDSVITQD